jgi:hypothetical protein
MIGTLDNIKSTVNMSSVDDTLFSNVSGAVEVKLRRVIGGDLYDACETYASSGGSKPDYYDSILFAQSKLYMFYVLESANYFFNGGKGLMLTETHGGGGMQSTKRYANPSEIDKIRQSAFDIAIQTLRDCGYTESYSYPIEKIEAGSE